MPYPLAAVRGKNFGVQAASYGEKVLSYSPIAYWKLNEASGTDAFDSSGNSYDGTHEGCTLGQTGIGDGETCPVYDGTNDSTDVYSAGFVGAFDKAEGTLQVWLKVSGVGVWTDGSRSTLYFRDDSSNRIEIFSTGASILAWLYAAGGTENQRTKGSMSETGWIHAAMTWSVTGDAVKAYYNGVQEGATMSSLGTFVGPLDDYCDIGSKGANSLWWDGYAAHAAVWDSVLNSTQILDLATV